MQAIVSREEKAESSYPPTSRRGDFQIVTLPTGVRTIIVNDYRFMFAKVADEFDRLPWLSGPEIVPRSPKWLRHGALAISGLVGLATVSFWAGQLSTKLF